MTILIIRHPPRLIDTIIIKIPYTGIKIFIKKGRLIEPAFIIFRYSAFLLIHPLIHTLDKVPVPLLHHLPAHLHRWCDLTLFN